MARSVEVRGQLADGGGHVRLERELGDDGGRVAKRPTGASAETSISNGISAVNAWDAMP